MVIYNETKRHLCKMSLGLGDITGPKTACLKTRSQIDPESIGEWPNVNVEDVAAEMQRLIDALYAIAGVHAVGGGNYVTQYKMADDAVAVQSDMIDVIDVFISHVFFDEFCQNATAGA